MASKLLGLRTVTYHTPDLAKGKAWYTLATGVEPYFDMPFYVGFNVGGYELGLVPDAQPGKGGQVVFWGVADAKAAWEHLISIGGIPDSEIQDVGEGILVASVLDPFGNQFGIIENPHFSLG